MENQKSHTDIQKSIDEIDDDNIVLINVSGHRFETKRSTLEKYPNTLLGSEKRELFYNKTLKEYYFDRDPNIFRHILNYYRTDKLHCPQNECLISYDVELTFFGIIAKDVIDDCCYEYYQEHKQVDTIKYLTNKDNSLKNYQNPINIRQKLGQLFENPHTSITGFIVNCITGLFTVIFVISYYATYEKCCFGKDLTYRMLCSECFKTEFFYLDLICLISFTIEFLLRLITTSNHRKFICNIINIIDFITVIIYFNILFVFDDYDILRSIITLRIFRLLLIFKFCRDGLNLLCRTLKACALQLIFFIFLLITAVIIFSAFILHVEENADIYTKFTSLRHSTWFIIVSMTTLGYGDVLPMTVTGQICSMIATLCGILIISLIVTAIVSNFLRIKHDDERIRKLEAQKKIRLAKISNITASFGTSHSNKNELSESA